VMLYCLKLKIRIKSEIKFKKEAAKVANESEWEFIKDNPF
jgi:hypothetical protein